MGILNNHDSIIHNNTQGEDEPEHDDHVHGESKLWHYEVSHEHRKGNR